MIQQAAITAPRRRTGVVARAGRRRLGTVALVVSSVTISYLTAPLWWWAVPDPHHNYAVLNLGIYTVTSTALR